jgi:hypothetical protein
MSGLRIGLFLKMTSRQFWEYKFQNLKVLIRNNIFQDLQLGVHFENRIKTD